MPATCCWCDVNKQDWLQVIISRSVLHTLKPSALACGLGLPVSPAEQVIMEQEMSKESASLPAYNNNISKRRRRLCGFGRRPLAIQRMSCKRHDMSQATHSNARCCRITPREAIFIPLKDACETNHLSNGEDQVQPWAKSEGIPSIMFIQKKCCTKSIKRCTKVSKRKRSTRTLHVQSLGLVRYHAGPMPRVVRSRPGELIVSSSRRIYLPAK